MSIAIKVDIGDAMQRLDRVLPAISNGLLAGAVHVKGKLTRYPQQKHLTRKSVYGSSFKSDRQRRWFFASGIHQTPYRRTRNLANRWSISSSMGGLTQIIGNNTSYGPYVQGPGMQSLYHRAQNWQTTDEVAEQESDKVAKLVLQAIQRAIA